MKNTIIIGIAMIATALTLLFVTGCPAPIKANVTVSPEPSVDLNPITGEPYYDIPEKRGVITNITEFDELLRRASGIETFRYKLTDTGLGVERQEFLMRSRFVKLRLNDVYYNSDGTKFDEILMDRVSKTALSHCSKQLCNNPVDKEVEHVDYSDYYQWDPIEYIYRITEPTYVDQEIIGDQYTKVFNAKFEGKDTRVWIQEYYGFPIKILVREDDGNPRTITFEDIMVDEVRSGEIELPFNFTVSGEGTRKWWTWEHYLGELDDEGVSFNEFQQKIAGV